MSENEVATSPVDEDLALPSDGAPAPSSEPQPAKPAAPRKKPTDYRLFDDGGGDFRIYEIIPQGHERFPAGTLMPIPQMPGATTAREAQKLVRAKAEQLAGKQIMVLRGIEIVRIQVDNKPRLMIDTKPRQKVAEATE